MHIEATETYNGEAIDSLLSEQIKLNKKLEEYGVQINRTLYFNNFQTYINILNSLDIGLDEVDINDKKFIRYYSARYKNLRLQSQVNKIKLAEMVLQRNANNRKVDAND